MNVSAVHSSGSLNVVARLDIRARWLIHERGKKKPGGKTQENAGQVLHACCPHGRLTNCLHHASEPAAAANVPGMSSSAFGSFLLSNSNFPLIYLALEDFEVW
eukprot:scpid47289/ scgid22081/ 